MKLFNYHPDTLPDFEWNNDALIVLLGKARNMQGKLMGKMESLGFVLSNEAHLETLTLEAVKSAEIEGITLNPEQVRSSIAKRLGINNSDLILPNKYTESVVDIVLDATQDFEPSLTSERLFSWYLSLLHVEIVQNNYTGSNSIISNENELNNFIEWFNSDDNLDPFIKAGLAYLWFSNINSFYKYNGIIARNIVEMTLSKYEKSSFRFYSISAQFCSEQKAYYYALKMAQRGMLDVTAWLQWFLNCLMRAITSSEQVLAGVLFKQRFWNEISSFNLNERQILLLKEIRKGLNNKLTSSLWAYIAGCSTDTALRDIRDLITKRILKKETAGGRSTYYSLDDIS